MAGTCRRLRWKGMFIEIEPEPGFSGLSDGPFWCTHTMNCLGPDARPAGRSECGPDRPCYEPGYR
jgi:hypothetical protein